MVSGTTTKAFTVTFNKLYGATFTESGLPSGTAWYVNITGHDSGPILTPSHSLTLANGTYTFTVSSSNKEFAPSSYTGKFTINGGSPAIPAVAFSKVTYSVTFAESGLSSGTAWKVTFSNGTPYQSGNTSIVISLPNGTYHYTVSNVSGFSVQSQNGTITVNGHSLTVNVVFSSVSTPGTSGILLYIVIGVIAAAGVSIGVILYLKKKKT